MRNWQQRGGSTDPGVALFVQIIAVLAGFVAGMWVTLFARGYRNGRLRIDAPARVSWPVNGCVIIAFWLCLPNGLLAQNSPRLDELIAQLRADSPRGRIIAIQSLEEMGQAAVKAIPELTRLVDDYDRSVQSTAVEALAGLGPAAISAAPRIISRRHDRDPTVWRDARGGLAKLGPGVVVYLVDAIESDAALWKRDLQTRNDADIQAWARRQQTSGDVSTVIEALGPAAVPPLRRILVDAGAKRNDVRQWAVAQLLKSLGAIAAPALPDLRAALATAPTSTTREELGDAIRLISARGASPTPTAPGKSQ